MLAGRETGRHLLRSRAEAARSINGAATRKLQGLMVSIGYAAIEPLSNYLPFLQPDPSRSKQQCGGSGRQQGAI
jgi:hypothetical protein